MAFQSEFLRGINGALVTEWSDTKLIHQGKGFAHQNSHSITGVGGIVDHLIVTPSDKEIHLRSWEVGSTGGTYDINVYKNTIVSANGTSDPVGCLNLQLNTVSSFNLYIGPTVTNVGTEILSDVLASSTTIGSNASSTLEWVLAKNSKYLFRVTKQNTGTEKVSFKMFWYEL